MDNLEIDKIHLGDCLDLMKGIPDESIDMILCDLPYGTTACKWDVIIPFKALWEAYNRVIKDKGAIVLTSRNPFTCELNHSNLSIFRYELIWEKEQATNFLFIKNQFGSIHENISVFYKHQPTYNPQLIPTKIAIKSHGGNKSQTQDQLFRGSSEERFYKYPCSVLRFNRDRHTTHPTQKPVSLFEYLIRTYTNEGMLILDNCIGSGTTAVAAKNLKRHFIGIEKEEKYYKTACERVGQDG